MAMHCSSFFILLYALQTFLFWRDRKLDPLRRTKCTVLEKYELCQGHQELRPMKLWPV